MYDTVIPKGSRKEPMILTQNIFVAVSKISPDTAVTNPATTSTFDRNRSPMREVAKKPKS